MHQGQTPLNEKYITKKKLHVILSAMPMGRTLSLLQYSFIVQNLCADISELFIVQFCGLTK